MLSVDSIVAKRMTESLLGATIAGWTLETTLGFGKSAIVFRAKQGERYAAVKVFDPEIVSQFGAEAQRTRVNREKRLVDNGHPHLISILDAGEDAERGLFFVVMEFFDGPNLAQVIRSVPREAIRHLIKQVASAARFLEELGLAHRDIKPENIGVTRDFERAVLLDLGVVHPVGGLENVTDDGTQRAFVGTLRYSPPELLVREEKDSVEGWRSVTFYQLGGVLHDLLERRPIFDGVSPWARLVEAVRHMRPQFSADDVPMDLRLLAGNCLQKDPAPRCVLVSWADFEREPPPAAFDEAVARIAYRRAQRGDGSSAAQVRESAAQLTDRGRRAVETAIQQLLQSGLFPPVELRAACTNLSFNVQAVFAPATVCGLTTPLRLEFSGVLGSDRMATHAAAALGPDGVPYEAVPHLIMVGEDVQVLQAKVKEFAVAALDAAEQSCAEGPGAAEPRPLRVEGSWTQLGG